MKRFTIRGWVKQKDKTDEMMPVEIRNYKAETRAEAVISAIKAFYPTLVICGADEEKEVST